MSSSDPNSKIDFLDSPSVVKSKIAKAHCAPGAVEGNGVLAFVRAVIVPIGNLMKGQGRSEDRIWAGGDSSSIFTVSGDPKFGGKVQHFSSVEELEASYAAGEVHPGDLKVAVTNAINALLAPIQADFAENEEFRRAEGLAYPVEVKEVFKKEKKDKGTKPDHVLAREAAKRETAAAAAGAGGLEETKKMVDGLTES